MNQSILRIKRPEAIVKESITILSLFALFLMGVPSHAATDLWQLDFEAGNPLASWQTFTPGTEANVAIGEPGAWGSARAAKAVPSKHGGLVALSGDFPQPQARILIEFDFAFSASDGRTFNVWSHADKRDDASQLNLCIQGGRLQQYDGRTRSWETITSVVQASATPERPVWHRLRAVLDADANSIDFWISKPGESTLPTEPVTMAAYHTHMPIAGLDLVSGTRIAKDSWYLVDNLIVRGGSDIPAPRALPKPPEPYLLWTGGDLPPPDHMSDVPGMTHTVIQQATEEGFKFLHGAAIIEHNGVLYANWANSPVDENSDKETLQGRRSTDGGKTWSELEVIGTGFPSKDRHSHGVLMEHQGELWTFAARFGVGEFGKRFPGLCAEAFVLNKSTDQWETRGLVMGNCWPYDEPVRMKNGSYITGGQDKDGLPVVAYSKGDNLLEWTTRLIPVANGLSPSFAETTVLDVGDQIVAVIRGGKGVAWISTSDDFGQTWTPTQPSNFPMPRGKAYFGRLSTGQLYLLANNRNRDTLVIAYGEPGANTLSKVRRIRFGRSEAPRFKGFAKSPQWSYPYGHEHDGKLYVVYSIGKEDCGLSILPLSSLK